MKKLCYQNKVELSKKEWVFVAQNFSDGSKDLHFDKDMDEQVL